MSYLDSLMGLDPNGLPTGQEYPADPMMAMAMQGNDYGLMEELGVPHEDPYAMVGMEAPMGQNQGAMLTQEMLGGPAPRFTQADINQLAQSLGLSSQNGVVDGYMQDPMFSQRFDLTNFIRGM